MRTEDLIKAIAADAGRRQVPAGQALVLAAAAAAAVAAIVFVATLGPRPDFAAAMATLRFPAKFVYTLTLLGGALVALRALSRPEGQAARTLPWLLAAPVLLLAAVVAELLAVPPESRLPLLLGTNRYLCLFYIPLIGLGPLAAFLAALRHGAPTRPALAGAVAGLCAGGVAATLYAAHCTDDSPLFVATWYTLAIAILAALGAVLGPRVARW